MDLREEISKVMGVVAADGAQAGYATEVVMALIAKAGEPVAAPTQRSDGVSQRSEGSVEPVAWRDDLDWHGQFSLHDPDPSDDHSALYLVMPNGLMVNISCDPREGLDVKRGNWLVSVLNAGLLSSEQATQARETVLSDTVRRMDAWRKQCAEHEATIRALQTRVAELVALTAPAAPTLDAEAVARVIAPWPFKMVEESIADGMSWAGMCVHYQHAMYLIQSAYSTAHQIIAMQAAPVGPVTETETSRAWTIALDGLNGKLGMEAALEDFLKRRGGA